MVHVLTNFHRYRTIGTCLDSNSKKKHVKTPRTQEFFYGPKDCGSPCDSTAFILQLKSCSCSELQDELGICSLRPWKPCFWAKSNSCVLQRGRKKDARIPPKDARKGIEIWRCSRSSILKIKTATGSCENGLYLPCLRFHVHIFVWVLQAIE